MRHSRTVVLTAFVLVLAVTPAAVARGNAESTPSEPAAESAPTEPATEPPTEPATTLPATQIQHGTSNLFVNTAPIRADVIVDGTPVGATPLLLRGIRSGSHTVTIQKPGYVMVDEEVSVGTGETGVIAERLKATEFVAAFSAPTTIVNGQSYERTSSRFVLPTATYMLSADDTSLSIDPVYPLEGAFKTLLYVTPALAVISIGATLEDVWLRDKETGLPTPATFASWAATTAGGGMLIALALDRRRFFEETSIDEYTPALTGAESESLFNIGESALVAGNLPAALANYTQVVAHGADSEYVPGALYKTARIYQLSGDFDLALPAFTLLVERFPDPEYYDAALKATADLHVARGEYQDALDALDLMLFVDAELFPRSEIGDYAAEIRESMATGLPVESALEPAAEPAEEEQP